MIVTVFDHLFKRVDILSNFTYLQYTDCYDDIGDFTVNALLDERNKKFLHKDEIYYLHFEDGIMGKVEDAKVDQSNDPNVIVLTGSLLGFILTKRVIGGTQSAMGSYAAESIQNMLNNAFGMYTRKGINIAFSYGNVVFDQTTKINKQQTGGTIWKWIQALLQLDNLGYHFVANIGPLTTYENELGDSYETNVTSWSFELRKGMDRTRGNKEGNKAVIFSTDLSNLISSMYEVNRTEYANECVIAGEGEGSERVWMIVHRDGERPDLNAKTGWDYEQMFVDARDVQSGEDWTPEEYSSVLNSRADDKLAEVDIKESYEGTVRDDGRHLYGKDADYWKGDLVTLEDKHLGIVLSARITKVTKTIQGVETMLDLTFGYQEILPIDKLKKEGVV